MRDYLMREDLLNISNKEEGKNNFISKLTSEFYERKNGLVDLAVYQMILSSKDHTIAQETIGNIIGLHRNRVGESIDRLIDNGYISIESTGYKYSMGSKTTSYKILREEDTKGCFNFNWNIFCDIEDKDVVFTRAVGLYFWMRGSMVREDNRGRGYYRTDRKYNRTTKKYLEKLIDTGLITAWSFEDELNSVYILFRKEKQYGEFEG